MGKQQSATAIGIGLVSVLALGACEVGEEADGGYDDVDLETQAGRKCLVEVTDSFGTTSVIDTSWGKSKCKSRATNKVPNIPEVNSLCGVNEDSRLEVKETVSVRARWIKGGATIIDKSYTKSGCWVRHPKREICYTEYTMENYSGQIGHRLTVTVDDMIQKSTWNRRKNTCKTKIKNSIKNTCLNEYSEHLPGGVWIPYRDPAYLGDANIGDYHWQGYPTHNCYDPVVFD